MSQSTTFFSVFTSHTQGKIFFILLCEALLFFFPRVWGASDTHFLLCFFHRASPLSVSGHPVPSVMILSLQSSSCPFSALPPPLLSLPLPLILEGYKQNCQVPALGLRFKGPKFPDSLYSQVFRFKIINIWKRSMPSTNSCSPFHTHPLSSTELHCILQ